MKKLQPTNAEKRMCKIAERYMPKDERVSDPEFEELKSSQVAGSASRER